VNITYSLTKSQRRGRKGLLYIAKRLSFRLRKENFLLSRGIPLPRNKRSQSGELFSFCGQGGKKGKGGGARFLLSGSKEKNHPELGILSTSEGDRSLLSQKKKGGGTTSLCFGRRRRGRIGAQVFFTLRKRKKEVDSMTETPLYHELQEEVLVRGTCREKEAQGLYPFSREPYISNSGTMGKGIVPQLLCLFHQRKGEKEGGTSFIQKEKRESNAFSYGEKGKKRVTDLSAVSFSWMRKRGIKIRDAFTHQSGKGKKVASWLILPLLSEKNRFYQITLS